MLVMVDYDVAPTKILPFPVCFSLGGGGKGKKCCIRIGRREGGGDQRLKMPPMMAVVATVPDRCVGGGSVFLLVTNMSTSSNSDFSALAKPEPISTYGSMELLMKNNLMKGLSS